MWPQLESFAALNCSLAALDDSLALLPGVKAIRLSQNQISSIAPLAACPSLQDLDLSFNALRSVRDAGQFVPHVIVLDLSHNALESTAGLETLVALEVLDLSHNAIAHFAHVGALAALPNLHSLHLLGNPIARASTYRTDVQKLLTTDVLLDGVPWTSQRIDDFATQTLADVSSSRTSKGEISSSSSRDHHPTRALWDAPKPLTVSEARPNADVAVLERSRVAELARSLLLAIAAIALVQSGIHVTQGARDLESERVLLRAFAPVAALAALLLVLLAILSRLATYWTSQSAVTPTAMASSTFSSHTSTSNISNDACRGLHHLSRRLSVCLVDEQYVRQESQTSGSHVQCTDARVSLDVLHTSLQRLIESPEVRLCAVHLSLHHSSE